MDKWDFIKLKSFCTTKEKVSKLNRPSIEWEKIICWLYIRKRTDNQNIQGVQNTKLPKINEPVKKWETELTEVFQRKKSKWPKNT
jgi:hypothetical protein